MKHSIIMAVGILMAALPALGHHSDAALDMNSVLTFEGLVTEYSMRNPHTYFTVETINDAGETVEWTVQMASALTVARRGWTRDTLSVGDRVTVGVRPSRDGRPYGLLTSVERGGVPVATPFAPGSEPAAPQTAATTSSLEGVWIVDPSSRGPDYPGGLDQLMIRELLLIRLVQHATICSVRGCALRFQRICASSSGNSPVTRPVKTTWRRVAGRKASHDGSGRPI